MNAGGIGNTIDDLLGFPESNLPISDSAQWELKSHRIGSASLLTLFHMEPDPRSHRIVPNLLLPNYGWPDASRANETSFRQTLNATQTTDRGFGIEVDRLQDRVVVYFDSTRVQPRHNAWLANVRQKVGLSGLNPAPYWGFQDLFLKASTKMLNSFYIEAETMRSSGDEYFKVRHLIVLQGFDIDRFVVAIEQGQAFVDFDARTHHNHGTKFRLRQDAIPNLYRFIEMVA